MIMPSKCTTDMIIAEINTTARYKRNYF